MVTTLVRVSGGSLTLSEVRDLLDATVCWGPELGSSINAVGAADLMSDALALGRPGMLLLTGLNTPQAVRTATISDFTGIVFVRGKTPSPEMIAMAKQSGTPMLSTALTLFEASGRLYAALFGSNRTDG